MSKFVIVESFTHHIPTGLGYLEGLTQLGHEAYSLPTTHYSINDIEDDIDYVVILGWPDADEVIKFKQNNPEVGIVVVCFGWNDVVDKLANYVSLWVEHTHIHDLADKVFEEHGHTLHHIPLGASMAKFRPLNTESIYDLSFIGQFGQSGHGYRHEDVYLYPLMAKSLKGYYSGFANYPFTPHDNLNAIYNKTKINVNFHYWDQKCQTDNPETRIDFNGRVFEIALSGGFQLCDHPFIESYFGGEGIVAVSSDEWVDAFDYYINHPAARLAASEKARKVALEKHTWMSRINQLIDLL